MKTIRVSRISFVVVGVILLAVGGLACRRQQQSITSANVDSLSVRETDLLRPITVWTPGQSLQYVGQLPYKPPRNYGQTVQATAGKLSVSIDTSGRISVDCKSDSLKRELFVRDKLIEKLKLHTSDSATVREVIRREKVPVIVYHAYWYDKALRWAFLILIILIIIYLLIKKRWTFL
ncbi:hypothetical protein SAMN05421780_101548 [Flexibacter flexilis DSM 6793]|uniref:Uncharacterized protein n=1 Tax=Flexibacter flexilis DSM 6793 TaxID=927664 RepID=A0A1I1E0X9_9BACT|nr:hypothetical protein [Flexibacter flexilis]SFB80316.1 hypothetical protein SAMN05421780_101548 [Flexibacter flexilis DSM 6793]